jgi:hypothetical protein
MKNNNLLKFLTLGSFFLLSVFTLNAQTSDSGKTPLENQITSDGLQELILGVPKATDKNL